MVRPSERGVDLAEGPSDEALWDAYVRGDAAAFDALLERVGPKVYAFCLRMVRQPARAEDLTQEVFLRALRHRDTFEGRSKVSTWLLTIARNVCTDEARRRQHRAHASLDQPAVEGQSPLSERLPGPARDGEGRAMDAEFSDALERALQALPAEQREVFLLREVEGVPFADIAEMTGVPVNTVKSRMRYALGALRLHLEGHGGHGGKG